MKKMALACVLAAGVSMGAQGQQRTMNGNAPGVLRTWNSSPKWGVLLIRAASQPLACVLMTGQPDQSKGDQYFWGLMKKQTNTSLFILDRDSNAVSGSNIALQIDGTNLGSYNIDRRVEKSGMNNVYAKLPSKPAIAITSLFRSGGSVKFTTDNSTYTSTLEGAPAALNDFATCQAEAEQLNAVQNPDPAN